MPDSGHDLEFGYFLIPDAGDPDAVLATARLADRLGYDLLAIQDHPYQRRHLDALALAGVIPCQTDRIGVLHDVANVPLRPPAVFANRLEGARPGPKPAHPIGIWLGAAKPRALALTGRVADGWAAPLMNYMPPASAAEAQALIDRAAREAGHGFGTFAPIAPPDPEQLQTFIEDVAPSVLERVAVGRAG